MSYMKLYMQMELGLVGWVPFGGTSLPRFKS
jgi:hypothetical protein